MTDVEPPRRSRLGWPMHTEPTTTPAGTHSHKQSVGPLMLAFLCIVLLFLANIGLVWFILARSEARDASEQRMREQIRDSWCQALDGFPQSNPFLDPLRKQYDCGPGRPVEDFPPEIQQELNRDDPPPPPPPAPEGVEVLPDGLRFDGGASPDVEPAQPYYPTPGEAEPPPDVPIPEGFPPPDPVQPSAAPPLVDLEPVTESVCVTLGVCL